ncbi:MAG: hypothetical protein IJX85_11055 [Lachnospiraceae bacterium]|nr:hypothetical protein [Lachnospiraceae bacterium]
MKRTRGIKLFVISTVLMAVLTACGSDKDDELILIPVTTTEATTTEATTTEDLGPSTEEAGEKDSAITVQQLRDANRGDMLLAGGLSYGLNTIYYSGDKEVFSEYHFLGFDDQGMYAQVYEDSDGYIKLLDMSSNYWYIVDDKQLSILIYPEQLVGAAIIDSNHNDMVFSFLDIDSGTELVQDVYRRDGELIVETLYGNAAGENYYVEYTLDDNWMVQEYNCFDKDGNKFSYSKVTPGASYAIPDMVTEAKAMADGYRTVNVTFTDGAQLDSTYYTPLNVPIDLSTIEYVAYSDAGCTTPWKEVEPDEAGVYKDVTIYMKLAEDVTRE